MPLPEAVFSFAGEPVPWARARRGKYGNSFTAPAARHYGEYVALSARLRWGRREPLHGVAVGIGIATYRTPPQRHRGPFPAFAIARPDLDNYVKLILDAMSGIVYHDDALVCVGQHLKFYDPHPRVEVAVYVLGEQERQFHAEAQAILHGHHGRPLEDPSSA